MNGKHVRTQFYGSYFNAALQAEEWSMGINWILNSTNPAGQGSLPSFVIEQTANNSEDTGWTWHNNWLGQPGGAGADRLDPVQWGHQLGFAMDALFSNNEFSDQCTFKGVKIYPIQTDGKAHDYVATIEHKTPARGGGTAGMLPPQNSIVASLVTSVLGAHGRGRVYLPGINRTAIESYGTLATGGPVVIAGHMVTFLAAGSIIGTIPLSDHWVKPIVTGPTRTDYGVVSSVRVGTIVDTQRRRRNQLTEVYETAAM